jgi:hypothetical protein
MRVVVGRIGNCGLTIVAFYTAMPYNYVMIFIETSTFTNLTGTYLSDDEYLIRYPVIY